VLAAARVQKMRRSGIREVMDLAARRADTIHLEVGQPDFPTPPHVIDAACRAARNGYTTYTPNRGLLEVRESVSAKLARDNGIAARPDDIVITSGAVTGLLEALTSVVNPGDTILLPDPGWPNYEMMAGLVDARIVRYPLVAELGYEPDLERLAALIHNTPGAKAIVVNSPGNPTGAVFSRATVEALTELTARAGLYLVSDECYEQILFEGEHVSPGSLPGADHVISVFSMSKSYAMTGWRMGYVTGHPEIVDLIAKLQEPMISCACAVAQKAGQAALDGDQTCVQDMVEHYRERRDAAVELLADAGLLVTVPHGAFYIMADISRSTADSYAFARRLVEERGVAVAPGETFGPSGAGLVRLSLAANVNDLRRGTERLVAAVLDRTGR
jgi:aspartate/methionine/tyrosine aminotransferase